MNGDKPLKRKCSLDSLGTSAREEEGADRPEGAVSRNSFKNHGKTFLKHFPEISEVEKLNSAFTCAIQKEVLYHGKMYLTDHHVCFHSSVLLKETKVVIQVSTILAVKKKNTARVVPNAICIMTNTGEKYLFVSLRNRDACFQLIRSLSPQLQAPSATGSPFMSSAENGHELEADTISSHSSLEDSVDHRRISFPHQGKSPDSPLSSLSDSGIPNGRDRHSPEKDDTAAVSWVTMVTEKIRSAFSMSGTTSINKLFIVYLILAILLLLSSGYIGLRIVALEEQLNLLGAMPAFDLQRQ